MELFKKIFTAITGEQPEKLQEISDRLKKVASSLEDGTLTEKVKNAVSKLANVEGEELDTEGNTFSSEITKKKGASYKENTGSSLIKITCFKKVITIAIPNTETKITRALIADVKKYDVKNYDVTAIDMSNCDNILALGDNVFFAFVFLKEVILPKNIEEIGACSFKKCTSLGSIDLSMYKKLRVIRSHTFDSCENLSTIRFPENIEEIGEYAFRNCTSLTSINLSNYKKLQTIGSHAFNSCKGLSEIRFPENIEEIGEYAFRNCTSLTSINLSNYKKLQTIGSHAFASCKGLSEIRFPENIKEIGYSAFWGCDSLIKIDLSNYKKLQTIGSNAFDSCSGLSEIHFPENIEEIGDLAFGGCDSLAKIDLSHCKKLSEINLFFMVGIYNNNIMEIILPEGVSEVRDADNKIMYIPPTVKSIRFIHTKNVKFYCYSPKLDIIGSILALGDLYVLPQYLDSYVNQAKAEGVKIKRNALFHHESNFGNGHIYPIPQNKCNFFDRYK